MAEIPGAEDEDEDEDGVTESAIVVDSESEKVNFVDRVNEI